MAVLGTLMSHPLCANESLVNISAGHVLYEMAEGKCFSIPLPSKDEYRGSSVEEVLDYIFEMVEKNKDISHKEALKKVQTYRYSNIAIILYLLLDHEAQVFQVMFSQGETCKLQRAKLLFSIPHYWYMSMM